MRLMVTGDFTGKESDVPVEDREVINLNKDNFQKVMKSQELGLEYTVDNKMTGEGEMSVELNIENMKDFSPEEIAKQVPGLSRLLAARNLLQDLRNRLISVRDFRQQLESVISDEAAREELLAELEKVVPSVRDDAGEAGD